MIFVGYLAIKSGKFPIYKMYNSIILVSDILDNDL